MIAQDAISLLKQDPPIRLDCNHSQLLHNQPQKRALKGMPATSQPPNATDGKQQTAIRASVEQKQW